MVWTQQKQKILRRGARIHRRTVEKHLHDPDNHDDVITHLEPDIMECEVKWALGSITTNKASGHDGIPVELFQILKDDAVKVLHSICQQIWKIQYRTGKDQFSFQTQRKAIPKNAATFLYYNTIALISHASKVMLKLLQARLQQYMNSEFQIFKLFRKDRGTMDQIANICWIIRKAREFQKKHLFLLY